jgi:predicted HTH domain antitoxin
MSWLEELRVNDLKEELSQRGVSFKSNCLKKDLVQLIKDVTF